ncbi:hypothetical protein M011DRAFT_523354 [Sporormia fimetaria CBS 119925]|uniref:Uncharacterized protein n=1 Tax=Sporormia fimetaria CBS 119925 TaxID=1340428 RepID=A0A6A6VL63_9PLEO|nr:hypothetical protein M011DRAFT_523354 [Sporormia fimetaria CBS 119925]
MPSPSHTLSPVDAGVPNFQVHFSPNEVAILADEVYNDTVAEVTFSLFLFWVTSRQDNYETARGYIRELGLDQGYTTNRIANANLRKLVDECLSFRPSPPTNTTTLLRDPGNPGHPRDRVTSAPTLPTASAPELTPTDLEILAWSSRIPARSPPNTPDRPAPLSIRSREGSIAGKTVKTPTTALLRSVSSPLRMMSARRELEMGEMGMEMGTAKSDERATKESKMAREEGGMQEYSPSLYSQQTGGEHQGGEGGDVARAVKSPNGVANHWLFGNEETDGAVFGSEQILEPSGLGSRNSSDVDVDETTEVASTCPSDVTAATDGDQESLTGYIENVPLFFGSIQHPRNQVDHPHRSTTVSGTRLHASHPIRNLAPPPFLASPAPTPAQRRAAAHARRISRSGTVTQDAIGSVYRSLPLRNVPSVHHEPLMSGLVAHTSPARSQSLHVTPTKSSVRSGNAALAYATLTGSSSPRRYNVLPAANSSPNRGPPTARLPSHRTVQRDDVQPQRAVPTSPTPRNGRGDHHQQTDAAQASTAPSLHDSYMTNTAAYISHLLHRTQARGSRLRLIRPQDCSPADRAWRQNHHRVLVTVYGSADVELTDADIRYVEQIAQALQSSSSRNGTGWKEIEQMFELGQ